MSRTADHRPLTPPVHYRRKVDIVIPEEVATLFGAAYLSEGEAHSLALAQGLLPEGAQFKLRFINELNEELIYRFVHPDFEEVPVGAIPPKRPLAFVLRERFEPDDLSSAALYSRRIGDHLSVEFLKVPLAPGQQAWPPTLEATQQQEDQHGSD